MNNIVNKFDNLDSEIEQAIEEANNTFLNLAKSIRKVYDISISKGYEPLEARKIVETRIINVSPRYLRQLLPPEAKDQSKVRDQDLRHKMPQTSESENNKEVNITTKHEITDVDSTPEPHTTFEYHKASDDEQEKYFRMDSEIDKYKKLAFDKQQIIDEKDIQIERLTNQVNEQAEHIKQNITSGTTQEQPKIFPFTLETKTLMHECPKCHLHQDLPVTGRVYHQNSWIVYIDNTEAQKQQAQKWRT